MRSGWQWLGTFLLISGCQPETVNMEAPALVSRHEAKSSFDPAATGDIVGCILWQGERPHVADLVVHAYMDHANRHRLRGTFANPHAPRIAEDGGVGEVVVGLADVSPGTARPWNHAPAVVEIHGDRLEVVQGSARGRVGLVRRGDSVEFVCRAADYHTLRVRGAAFFTLPFASPDRPTRRRFDHAGMVELSTGGGFYWRRAYLWVLDHPYAAVTGADGRFRLTQVPAGTYLLTAWLPNWRLAAKEHDPEVGTISRVRFAPALQLRQTITVAAGQTTEARLTAAAADFAP